MCGCCGFDWKAVTVRAAALYAVRKTRYDGDMDVFLLMHLFSLGKRVGGDGLTNRRR